MSEDPSYTPEKVVPLVEAESPPPDGRAKGPQTRSGRQGRRNSPRPEPPSNRSTRQPPGRAQMGRGTLPPMGEDGESVKPPLSNRGVTVAKLDYLTIQVFGPTDHVIPTIYSLLFKDPLKEGEKWADRLSEPTGSRYYQNRYAGPLQTHFHVGPRFDAQNHISLQISGVGCDLLGDARTRIYELLLGLKDLQLHYQISRCDFAFDHGPVGPDEARQLFLAKKLHTRARSFRFMEGDKGNTFYLGNRQSEKMLRIYNARGYNRIELECKSSLAQSVVHCWLDDPYSVDGALSSFCEIPGIELSPTEFRGVPPDQDDRERNELSEFARTMDRLAVQLYIAKEVFGGSIDEWLEKRFLVRDMYPPFPAERSSKAAFPKETKSWVELEPRQKQKLDRLLALQSIRATPRGWPR